MRIGRTAIDAIVSDAPASESAPNVSATATSARASGSSRGRTPKTSRSVAAMTISATASSVRSEPPIDAERSDTTTGAPVTV